jgi:hypothetical protein
LYNEPSAVWSILPGGDGLPPGITLNPATGLLSGTPTTDNIYAFRVGVERADILTVQEYLLVVDP